MIILASKSPRRLELMKYITEDFIVKSADADETLPRGISPEEAVLRLSAIKAEPFRNDEDTVIGADTVVALGRKILGKPKNDDDARAMLRSLSGKTHSVFTGVTIIHSQESTSFAVQTKVSFYELSDEDIERYIKTGEHRDKAGSYGIQGYGSLFVKEIKGDYFNVVGLPIGKLNKELKNFL
ncbi:Maf family protein [uncultured Eubacterium sp.]|uniref:Maf family protein n=1 Tax=uncultured Eubacterium sp. TaxID=165185 RepID=UPI002804E44A|nr:Maf family protein [uncultured Eubacterium sp.]